MTSVGIDIGSRTVKVVVIENNAITLVRKAENSFDTLKICAQLLEGISYNSITATGYGRNLFQEYNNSHVISEIKAFALGANYVHPKTRTVLDIGGQDTKAISLDATGRLQKFEMNDKCAAGTGRFLEIMAMALRFSLNEFGEQALAAHESVSVSSMCTVFAESEVISMLARGAKRENVAKGIHQSIVKRSIALLRRVSVEDDILFAGGVALNPCIVELLKSQTNKRIFIPKDPQIVGAIGAAVNSYQAYA